MRVNETIFQIKTEVFEGPLELLLHLIQKRKLFINDISLAHVADEYISHISNNNTLSIHSRAAFIGVASTLLLIKSKSLLPTLQLTEDEQEDIQALEIRLFLYKTIHESGNNFVKPLFFAHPQFSKIQKTNVEVVFSPDASITQESIHSGILDILQAIPEPKKPKPEVFVERVESLEDMIDSLTQRIQSSLQMSFSQFSRSGNKQTVQGQRVHVIVSFLALLELVRQGIVDASQGDRYGDIDISKSELPPRINSM